LPPPPPRPPATPAGSYVLKWDAHYDPELDAAHKEIQSLAGSEHPRGGYTESGLATPTRWPSGPMTWSDSGWSLGGGPSVALEALGRGVMGPSWAASQRSTAASRRLPTTGEEGEGGGGGGGKGEGGSGSSSGVDEDGPRLEDID
jgi:hypothetical protein